ncbi:2692_t:CDS:2 [Gigaspora margarita]|uniref:2692_t:CDS:1 n=1 Tax=Gigaspora margarita TaxID=4874 RepID=A0ABN7UZ49_GIGMA|nr:2692_t:CDS:2 [Gigaspora margarita]
MSLGCLNNKIRKTDQAKFFARLDRKYNPLVKSYREQNLKEELETEKKKILASFLKKPLNKIMLYRVLVKKNLKYRLSVAPIEILTDTKNHLESSLEKDI